MAEGKLLKRSRFAAAVTLGLTLFLTVSPALAGDIGSHEGVATCGGSTCHGRLAPTGKVVRQNELITWQDESSPSGAHSRAWQALTKARGEAIAARLGLGAAEHSQTCLGCHSDDVPAEKRGARFQISDGVSCESCHGGAGGWLSSHYAVGVKHSDNLKLGMTSLDNAKARASVCLDCHFGANKPGYVMTHRIMAAGHPRISFELDLFGALQSHYDFDADYAQRKEIPGGIRLWAVGQAMALDRVLSGFAERQDGMFPDFYFYDCQSCHRLLTDTRTPQVTAVPNPDRDTPRGAPVFDDENMIMLEAAVDTAAPGLASRFRNDVQNFHAALARDRSSAVQAAQTLAATARDLADAFSAHKDFKKNDILEVLERLLSGAVTARYTDYSGGAQAVMGIDTLLNALVTAGYVPRSAENALRPDIDTLYRDVRDPNAYRSQEFRDALARVSSAIRRL